MVRCLHIVFLNTKSVFKKITTNNNTCLLPKTSYTTQSYVVLVLKHLYKYAPILSRADVFTLDECKTTHKETNFTFFRSFYT